MEALDAQKVKKGLLQKAGLSEDVSAAELDRKAKAIHITTADNVPCFQATEIVSVIGAEAALGMNILRDLANAWIDTAGGRSSSVQKILKDAREACTRELKREAFLLGAGAVVAVKFSYNEVSAGGSGGSILFVTADGTAVKLSRVDTP